VIFPSHYQASKVVHPREHALDFPTSAKSSQWSSILSLAIRPASLSMRGDDFGTELIQHLFIQPIAVVCFVSNESLRWLRNKPGLNGLFDQLYFSRGSTLCAYGDRKTMAVGNCHDFSAFSPLRRPDAAPPFFAGANVPSIKHSRRSKPPRSLRSCAMANSTCFIILERTQFWNRRCTVVWAPYRSGMSSHCAPVRRIHSAPLSTWRRSLHGRPRPSGRTGSLGRMSLIIFHWSSVRSIRNYLYINGKSTSTKMYYL
jgi:hypothetical protein